MQITESEIPTITQETILETLSHTKANKASGPDNIGSKLLKMARYELIDIFHYFFNISLKNCFIPQQWKIADIVPIPKVPRPKTEKEYRPVCLTSVVCKTLEKIISKMILNMTKDVWKENKQYGFLPNRSTTDALIQVIEDWSEAVDKKLNIHAVFYDFSNAFDLVQHELLLKKLEKYLPNWLIKWLAH